MSTRQPRPASPARRSATVLPRLAVSLAVGAAAGALGASFGPWQAVPLLTWVAAALVWLVLIWASILGLDADATAADASEEDPHGPTADVLLLAASISSLGAVVLGVIKATEVQGTQKGLLLGAGIAAIVASWGVVHTVFTLRYAALYYRGTPGGVNFNEEADPSYVDFAYLAFTIGMTYQVSDTNLQSKAIRHTALRHALMSYLFGTVIIAATINLAAGLAH